MIVQVERVTTERMLSPQAVKLPGVLVDCVVVAKPENHADLRGGLQPRLCRGGKGLGE